MLRGVNAAHTSTSSRTRFACACVPQNVFTCGGRYLPGSPGRYRNEAGRSAYGRVVRLVPRCLKDPAVQNGGGGLTRITLSWVIDRSCTPVYSSVRIDRGNASTSHQGSFLCNMAASAAAAVVRSLAFLLLAVRVENTNERGWLCDNDNRPWILNDVHDVYVTV